mgnify:CR=1 FL=1
MIDLFIYDFYKKICEQISDNRTLSGARGSSGNGMRDYIHAGFFGFSKILYTECGSPSMDYFNSEYSGDTIQRFTDECIKLNKNIIKYISLSDPFVIGINITVSIWNIFYLKEIAEYFKSYPTYIHFNLVYYPKLQSIRNMPRELKDKALTQLSEIPGTEVLTRFINVEPSLDKELTLDEYRDAILKYTLPLDKSRNLNFKDCLPVLYNLLHP